MYISQLGQDKFVDEYFNKQEGLTFVEVGSHDGMSLSNTYFLEKERKWKGICVEPQKTEFDKLCNNRNCICENVAISDFEGESEFIYIEGYANMLSGLLSEYNDTHKQRIEREVNQFGGSINTVNVPVKKLQTILDKYNINKIDFCSIDTEGSELKVVTSIDFEKTHIEVLIIENNYNDTEIKKFLETKGYTLFNKLQWDDIFIKTKK